MERENVKVAFRCRPQSDDEEKSEVYSSCVAFDLNTNTVTVAGQADQPAISCPADVCFDESAINEQVYLKLARPLVDLVFKGVHATLISVGPTSAGKTHSLFGNGVQSGVIKRSCEEVFDRARVESVRAAGRQFRVRLSMCELRRDHVLDLLAPDTQRSLRIAPHRALGAVVSELVELEAGDVNELLLLMQQGLHVRESVARKVVQSKAHCIIDLHVDSGAVTADANGGANGSGSGVGTVKSYASATLRFVELAGISTDSFQADSSFVALDVLLDALAAKSASLGGSGASSSGLSGGVEAAYEACSLTQLLRASLGGVASTTVLGLLSPRISDISVNGITLRLANKFMSVVNRPRVNIDIIPSLIQQQREAIKMAREKLQLKQPGGYLHDVDPRLIDHLKQLLAELEMLKSISWDAKQLASLKAKETRKVQLEKENFIWVLDEPIAVDPTLTARLERERWKLVQLKKRMRETQQRIALLQEQYAVAYERADEDPTEAQEIYDNINKTNDELASFQDKCDKTHVLFQQLVREISQQEHRERKQVLQMHEVAALDRAQDDLDWQQIEAIKGADEKLQSKYETAKQVLEENGEQIQSLYPDGSILQPADVRATANQWAEERHKYLLMEADLKWERDYLMGKLLEKEVRHEFQIEKLQDQLTLMFKDYRRHFEDQKTRIEASCRKLMEEAINDTLHANQQRAVLEEKLKKYAASL